MEGSTNRSPLMFIHGAWLSARSWETFAEYFATAASTSPRPSGRARKATSRSCARTPRRSKGLGLNEIVDHYEELIRALDQPPVLIGHSFGGLIVELLLDRGLGRAGVAMSPAPPKGILVLPFSSLKAASPALAHPSKLARRRAADARGVHVRLRATRSRPRTPAAAYERYCVPETGQIFYEAGFANFHLHPPTEVHFKNGERAPLLIVGAEEDHTVPASVSKKQYKKYESSPARTDYLEFEGRPHLLMAAEGWEEVAAAIDSWLDGVPGARARADLRLTRNCQRDSPSRGLSLVAGH